MRLFVYWICVICGGGRCVERGGAEWWGNGGEYLGDGEEGGGVGRGWFYVH